MAASGRYGVRLYKQAFNFAGAHFLLFADGRRERLHGHNYQLRVEIDGPLGAAELVADFLELKPLIRELCGELDHRMLLPIDAPALSVTVGEREVEVKVSDGGRFVFPRADVVLLPLANTSTERLADLLAGRLRARCLAALPGLKMTRLRVEVEESNGQCGWFEWTAPGEGDGRL